MTAIEWKETKQLRTCISATERTIRRWPRQGKIHPEFYRYKAGGGRGGKQLEINPLGLPEPYRSEWLNNNGELATSLGQTRQEIDSEIYSELKDYQREYVDLWMHLFDRFGSLRGRELKRALRTYKQEHPDVSCSYQTFMRNKKDYDEQGLPGIIPDWGKREGDNITDDRDFELFKALYLKESRPTSASCWQIVRGAAKKAGRDVTGFPAPRTFLRRLNNEIPESAIYLARHGRKAWNRKYANYIERDKSDIAAGSCWVSDHRQLDVFIYSEKSGKAYRPWLTAWYDFKSGKWLSWWQHEAPPNSDHVFQTCKWAIEEFGKPDHIYIDNGKDYKCRDFAGGANRHKLQVDEMRSRSMIGMLGITPHFALPYNAQAKNIEPAFRQFIEYLEKHLPGYAGSYSKVRPEQTAEAIKRGQLIDEGTFSDLFSRFVSEVLNRRPSQGKEHKGLSPNELFYKEYKQKPAVRPESLRLFCMRTSRIATIMRNGVKDGEIGQRYYAEWMSGMKGRKVYLRRDIKKYQDAWVFDAETDEFLGKAPLSVTMNGLVSSDIDRQQLKELQAGKRREKKLMEAYYKGLEGPDPEQLLQYAIANQDAEEELRRANGDFLPYEETVTVKRMENTQADQVVWQADDADIGDEADLSMLGYDDAPEKKEFLPIWDIYDPKEEAGND